MLNYFVVIIYLVCFPFFACEVSCQNAPSLHHELLEARNLNHQDDEVNKRYYLLEEASALPGLSVTLTEMKLFSSVLTSEDIETMAKQQMNGKIQHWDQSQLTKASVISNEQQARQTWAGYWQLELPLFSVSKQKAIMNLVYIFANGDISRTVFLYEKKGHKWKKIDQNGEMFIEHQ